MIGATMRDDFVLSHSWWHEKKDKPLTRESIEVIRRQLDNQRLQPTIISMNPVHFRMLQFAGRPISRAAAEVLESRGESTEEECFVITTSGGQSVIRSGR